MAVHIQKRQGYISWDEYFYGCGDSFRNGSKDPNSQVGACIVSEDNKDPVDGIQRVSNGCSDDEFPWARGRTAGDEVFVCDAAVS